MLISNIEENNTRSIYFTPTLRKLSDQHHQNIENNQYHQLGCPPFSPSG
jgi:hypothetical protein